MKKILAILLALALILAFPVSVSAVTPPLDTPSITVPDISDNIEIELSDDFWDNYFKEHPLPSVSIPEETEEPTEPTEVIAEPVPAITPHIPDWRDLLRELVAKFLKGG